MTTTKTIASEDLWERADLLQEWVEELREDPSDAVLLQKTAEEFAETLTTIRVLSRNFEDW